MADRVGAAFKFASTGEVLACSTPDGSLKLWNSHENCLKQEYVPTSHLSASCTCLTWGPTRRKTPKKTPKKKKRKADGHEDVSPDEGTADLIAMGTAAGSILIYSVAHGDLKMKLEKGHSSAVTGLDWSTTGDSLFSCSEDGYIVEWTLATGAVKAKWRGDTKSLTTVCVCPKSLLLTASRSIHLWSTVDQTKVERFVGHTSPVFQLLCISTGHTTSPVGGDQDDEGSTYVGLYFLSAAVDDRIVNVWQVGGRVRKKRRAVMSLSLPDAVRGLAVSQPQDGQPLLVSATSMSGKVHIFEHMLNGPVAVPLTPRVTIQVASVCRTAGDTLAPIPVQTAMVARGHGKGQGASGYAILLAYGRVVPTCEEIPYDNTQAQVCLEREDKSVQRAVKTVESVTKVKTPSVPDDATLLAPALTVPTQPSLDGAKKRKRKRSTTEMSLADRLHALGKGATGGVEAAKNPTGVPQANTVSVLLAQALQSQDKKILTKVLSQTQDARIITGTLRQLPVTCVVPLVGELSKRAHQHAQLGHLMVTWIKALLSVHTSYLATVPQAVECLGTLYSLLDSRASMLGKFTKLQGKLDLMLSQVSKAPDGGDGLAGEEPVLIHHDDSSDEESADIDDLLMESQLESEDELMNGIESSDEEKGFSSGEEEEEDEEDMEDSEGDEKEEDDEDPMEEDESDD